MNRFEPTRATDLGPITGSMPARRRGTLRRDSSDSAQVVAVASTVPSTAPDDRDPTIESAGDAAGAREPSRPQVDRTAVDHAIAAYRAAIELDPGWTEGWTELGLLLVASDRAQAREVFAAALDASPRPGDGAAREEARAELEAMDAAASRELGTICLRPRGEPLVLHVFPDLSLRNPLDDDP